MCLCDYLLCVCVCVGTHGGRNRNLDPPELELLVVKSHPKWVLTDEMGPSGRAALTPTH